MDFEELMEEASSAMLMGDLDDADAIYEEGLAGALTDPQRAELLQGRAAIHIERERYREALVLMQQALPLHGDAVPASLWGNIAFAFDRVGKPELALEAHRRCVTRHEIEHGKDHPRTLRKMGDVAYPLIALGRLDEAEEILRAAIAGFEKQPTREPQWFAIALSNLGWFYVRSRRDRTRALDCFERAEGLRDASTLRAANGTVIREGFEADVATAIAEGRAAALALG